MTAEEETIKEEPKLPQSFPEVETAMKQEPKLLLQSLSVSEEENVKKEEEPKLPQSLPAEETLKKEEPKVLKSFSKVKEENEIDLDNIFLIDDDGTLFDGKVDLNNEENFQLMRAAAGIDVNLDVGITIAPKDTRKPGTCFNCKGAHVISECPLPRDKRTISQNRRSHEALKKEFALLRITEKKEPRYLPGTLSAEALKALNLRDDQYPQWIYRMRTLGPIKGYPPAWLKRLQVDDKRLTFHTDDPNLSSKPLKAGFEFDREKLVFYDGFNLIDTHSKAEMACRNHGQRWTVYTKEKYAKEMESHLRDKFESRRRQLQLQQQHAHGIGLQHQQESKRNNNKRDRSKKDRQRERRRRQAWKQYLQYSTTSMSGNFSNDIKNPNAIPAAPYAPVVQSKFCVDASTQTDRVLIFPCPEDEEEVKKEEEEEKPEEVEKKEEEIEAHHPKAEPNHPQPRTPTQHRAQQSRSSSNRGSKRNRKNHRNKRKNQRNDPPPTSAKSGEEFDAPMTNREAMILQSMVLSRPPPANNNRSKAKGKKFNASVFKWSKEKNYQSANASSSKESGKDKGRYKVPPPAADRPDGSSHPSSLLIFAAAEEESAPEASAPDIPIAPVARSNLTPKDSSPNHFLVPVVDSRKVPDLAKFADGIAPFEYGNVSERSDRLDTLEMLIKRAKHEEKKQQ